MTDLILNRYEHCDQSWVAIGPSSLVSPCPGCHTVVSPMVITYTAESILQSPLTERDEMLTMLKDASDALFDTNDLPAAQMSVKIYELLQRIKS